jgi:hypothetical protein
LTISKVAGLQTQLNDRYTKDEVDDSIDNSIVVIDQIEGLHTILDTKTTVTQFNQTQDALSIASVTIVKKYTDNRHRLIVNIAKQKLILSWMENKI